MTENEHLLLCLNEECVEIAKDVDKALRFGLDDINPLNPTGPSNKGLIIDELNDLMAVVDILIERNILPHWWQSQHQQTAKRAKVLKHLEIARAKGTIQ